MNSPHEPTDRANANDAPQSHAQFPTAELDWQAWLYVAGEFDDAARDAFEARLLEDTAACEAVARAVELSDLMAAARPAIGAATAIPSADTLRSTTQIAPAPVALPGAAWTQRAGWMALGAAACLAVMLAGRTGREGHSAGPREIDDNTQVATDVDDESRTLAVVWTDLWNMEDTLSTVDPDDDPLDRADAALARSSRDDDDSSPPDWLLAAVADDETDGALPAPPQPN